MGFLVTGAVMFLWLLIFNQWKRLRRFICRPAWLFRDRGAMACARRPAELTGCKRIWCASIGSASRSISGANNLVVLHSIGGGLFPWTSFLERLA